MYWSRWVADLTEGRTYLTLVEGFARASLRCVVSAEWQVFRQEIPWMTIYFTIAVWVSMSLAHAPLDAWRTRQAD